MKQAVKCVAKIFRVEPRYEVGDLLLGHRWSEVNIPGGETREGC